MTLPGSTIVIRDVWRGRVWDAMPAVVVDHNNQWLIDHQAPGAIATARTCRGRAKLDALESGTWEMAPTTVTEPGLNFYAANGWSRAGMSWSADYAEFHGWYLNLQEPLRTSRFGFDTMDLVLDVRVSPTGDWSWKDEDDFSEALDRQLFHRSVEPILRRHVDDIIGMLEERTGPFDERWRNWRPMEGWTTPFLPPDALVV